LFFFLKTTFSFPINFFKKLLLSFLVSIYPLDSFSCRIFFVCHKIITELIKVFFIIFLILVRIFHRFFQWNPNKIRLFFYFCSHLISSNEETIICSDCHDICFQFSYLHKSNFNPFSTGSHICPILNRGKVSMNSLQTNSFNVTKSHISPFFVRISSDIGFI